MGARRTLLGVLVSVCVLGCVLMGGTSSAQAAAGSFFFGPLGAEAGQIGIVGSFGMAVDEQSGDIYVGDPINERIDEFDGSGEFVRAWGWGVIPPGEGNERTNEFQVCTSATGCELNKEVGVGVGVGEFSATSPSGVAVDNEPGASHGDVYVQDEGNYRVEVFDSEGMFLRMFGGHVNRNGSDVCSASEATECQGGTEGDGDGEFDWAFLKSSIAVGPGGDVYVGDKGRVQVFEPSGVWKENVSLSALSSEGKVTALAVNAAGDVFVKVEGVPGVHGFEPDGVEMLAKYDESSEAIESVATAASGDLIISEREGGYYDLNTHQYVPCSKCDFLEYSPSGVELESFGGGTLVAAMSSALAFDEGLDEVLAYGSDDPNYDNGATSGYDYGVFAFPVPAPGPLVESGSEKSTAEPRGAATFEALVDPEGSSTEVRFEYVDEADFRSSGYADAVSTTPVVLGETGFAAEHVEAHLPEKTLVPGVTYHWRVVAHSSLGTNPGPDQSFEEVPSALIEGPWATSVTDTSVTLSAKIDPLGANTSYRLEYGTSSSYGHVFAGYVGEGTGYVTISYHLQELEPSMTYHYRLVSESTVGTVVGSDRVFVTQQAGGGLVLPDGRAWELVSPPDKGGALIENIENTQAASDGSGIVYSASEPLGEGVVGHVGENANVGASATLLSERGPDGWRTRNIGPRQDLPPEGETAIHLFGAGEAFYVFSPDLSLSVFEPRGDLQDAPQSSEATEPTLYLRDNANESYKPLVTTANVPAGTIWGPPDESEEMRFEAATQDLSHVLFSDWAALTPGATSEIKGNEQYEQNLYEWNDDQLQQVNIVPNTKTGREEPKLGAGFGTNSTSGGNGATNPWAMSGEGRWIVFHYNSLGAHPYWYVRDMVGHKTVPFGHPGGKTLFETMSRGGSKLFYLEPEGSQEEEGELYVLDPSTGSTTDLTSVHLDGEHSAGVQNMLVGASEDGSYVYFVATGVLASGAVAGQNNLYVMHEHSGEWDTTFIASLSNGDRRDWKVNEPLHQVKAITSRVSPDGRYVAFMSDRSLTGYDNVDAVSGQPDEEVYLYDAATSRLVCASCNPTGARPIGVDDIFASKEVLMDQSVAWGGLQEKEYETGGHWLAADIAPDWYVNWYAAVRRPPYLTDEGRLFFNSNDALVPQDTNGLADVYEYEPPGMGDCTTASATFGERSGGCVSLISSGQSSSESTFLDASENSDDVFFITASKLVGEDYDNVNDVYDAHVCSAAVPCRVEPVSSPPCTSGDSCKAAPSPQPEIFGPAPSATFNGAGNVVETAKSVVKPKAKTKKKTKKKRKKKKTGKSKGGAGSKKHKAGKASKPVLGMSGKGGR